MNLVRTLVAVSFFLVFIIAHADGPSAELQSTYLFWLEEAERQQALQEAQQFLKQLDRATITHSGMYEIYHESSKHVRERYSETAFVEAMKARTDLGDVRERAIEGTIGGFRKLPNLPGDQKYVIVTFNVKFVNSDLIHTEQVTLIKSDGTKGRNWNLAGYYIASKPFYVY